MEVDLLDWTSLQEAVRGIDSFERGFDCRSPGIRDDVSLFTRRRVIATFRCLSDVLMSPKLPPTDRQLAHPVALCRTDPTVAIFKRSIRKPGLSRNCYLNF